MPQHSSDYKLSAVKYYNKYKNYSKTCEIFGCTRTSLARWVAKYKKTKKITNKIRNRKSYKIRKVHVEYIKKIIKKSNNRFISLVELNKKLKKKFKDYDISSRWLGQVLKDNNITRKRTRKSHFPDTRYGKPISYKKEVNVFFKKIKKYKMKDVISIDETSIQPGMVKEYCRENKGKRCYFKTTDNKVFRKYTLLVAISNVKLIGYKLYEKGGSNADRFLEFIKEHILDKYNKKLLLFDNARAHTASKVLDKIKETNNDYVLNVPYSPHLNPIESFFSQLKHYLKLDSKINFNELKKSLRNAFKKIKKSNYKKYFLNSLDKTKLVVPKRKQLKPKKIYKD